MISSVKKNVTRNLLNIFGWRTDRKIVVIESDDWGTVRIPDKEVYETLKKKGLNLDSNPFNKYDSLESDEDFYELYGVLTKFKDKNGNPPVITANTLMCNPDFEKIKNSLFQEYHSELFYETYQKYPNHSEVLNLIQQGIKEKFYKPQFHAREHLNVHKWMDALATGNKNFRTAFDHGVFSIDDDSVGKKRLNYMAAFDFNTIEEKKKVEDIIKEGLELFLKIFGYKSKSIIAPCNVWHKDHERTFYSEGVKYIQGLVVQFCPTFSKDKYEKIYHYQGQKNKNNQHFFVRNCFFEPSTIKNYNWVGECLKRIETAFLWKKPAIISMHRLNFTGGLDIKNRTNNLNLFSQLLNIIVKKYPEIEFMASDELGDSLTNNIT